MTALLLGGCSDQPTPASGGPLDSVTQAARAARREAFLKEQAALTQQYEALKQEALVARPFRATLMLQRPTVIAFYPAWAPKLDTAALRAFLVRSKAIAAGAGWAFEERYSGTLRVTDVRSQTLYTLPLAADGMGFVLVAPVRHPQVVYGRNSASSLEDQLRRLRAWLPGAPPHSATELWQRVV